MGAVDMTQHAKARQGKATQGMAHGLSFHSDCRFKHTQDRCDDTDTKLFFLSFFLFSISFYGSEYRTRYHIPWDTKLGVGRGRIWNTICISWLEDGMRRWIHELNGGVNGVGFRMETAAVSRDTWINHHRAQHGISGFLLATLAWS